MKTKLLLAALAFSALTVAVQQWAANNLPAGFIAWWQGQGSYLDRIAS